MLRITILLFFIYVSFMAGGAVNVWDIDDLNNDSHSMKNKSFYLGLQFKANFYEAMEFCRYNGMNLATIDSKEENYNLITQKIKMGFEEESIWLSGSDVGHEGKFIWMSTGAPLIYTNFDNGQPDNSAGGTENCIEQWYTGKWNDRVCDQKLYFACEYY